VLNALISALRPVRFDEPVVVLDLETSGLDPAKDRILAVAAVPVEGHRVLLHQRFERLVHDQGPVNPEAIRHHRLRPLDVRGGAPLDQVMSDLVGWIADRPLVGYATAFDLAFLSRALSPLGLRLPRRHADVRNLQQQRDARRQPESASPQRFEQLAQTLGVPIIGRHEALGDAVTTALMWIALGHSA